MTMLEEIQARFPVRKSREQKESFRRWAVETAEKQGWTARVEPAKMLCMNHNIVIGNPEEAEIIITAHYDTPARMPLPNFITPLNVPLYILYQLALVAALAIPAVAAGVAVYAWLGVFMAAYWTGFAVYMALLLLLMLGPANPHNANDNTSGVAAVMELLSRVPEDRRGRAAFILFDNEEKGMLGSAAYARAHRRVKQEKLLVNLDCVGVGERLLFFAPKKVRALPVWERLQQAMTPRAGKTAAFYPMERTLYPSDQANFAQGVAVCACRRHAVAGDYCSRLHTPKDTLCDPACLEMLTGGLAALIDAL
ncbi:MAG: M28 family metallopeptidase [Aristaeellaceae bacterium]